MDEYVFLGLVLVIAISFLIYAMYEITQKATYFHKKRCPRITT